MRITRLQMHHVGRHRDLDIELAPGFTIVRGPNEAGKSTIQRGLELALFRRPTASTAELESLRSWLAQADDRPSVHLEFEAEREESRAPAGLSGETDDPGATPGPGGTPAGTGSHKPVVRGTLDKEFRGAKGRVRLEFDGQTHTDPARAEEVVASLTGIPSEAFFRSTASIRHQEIDDLDRDEGALRDRLQASIGGGDRGSSRARARLEDAIRALRSRGDKNPGRLKVAEEAVARAEVELRNGESALARLQADRDTLAAARAARQKADTELAESRNLLESARQAERLHADRTIVAERFVRLRQATETQRRLVELATAPSQLPAALREQLERLRALDGRAQLLRESLRQTDSAIEPDEPVPGYKSSGVAAAIAALAGIAVVTAGLVVMPLLAGVGAVLIVLAAVLGLVFRSRLGAANQVRRRNENRERDRIVRRQSRAGNEEGLRVADRGVQSILHALDLPSVAAAENLLAQEQTGRQEVATLRAQLGALLGNHDPAEARELRDKAALELEQKTAALEALGPIAADARARERLEAEVRDRAAALERSRDAEAAAAARIDANAVDAEQVAGEAERLASWRDQLDARQRRLRVYEATMAAISTAESTTMGKATSFLEQQVAADIARVTDGRYSRVRIDDQTLDVHVWAPERGDWVAANQLSKGTLDQIFLAARIGLVRLVTGGRRPPLVLDDPFVTFDDARAARAAQLLRELSTDFQVIYLTCSNRYDGLADAVVELPGPESGTGPMPVSPGEPADPDQAEPGDAEHADAEREQADSSSS